MIEEFMNHIPARWREESGKAFHSGRFAFSGARDLYILGFNPGGDPDLNRDETIADNADLVLRRAPEKWSAYIDEVFKPRGKPYPAGQAPLQLQMQFLLKCLGRHLREVPASDLIFLRSKQAGDIENPANLMESCWPFHQAVIEQLGVRVVLCLYKPVGEFVRMKTKAVSVPIDKISQKSKSGKQYWRECFEAPNGLRIVQITRPTGVPWIENACVLTKHALQST